MSETTRATPAAERCAGASPPSAVASWRGRSAASRRAHLADRRYLLDDFSVADPYLFAVLNWAQVTPIRLDSWPALTAYMARMHERPAVQRAFCEERELYLATLARTKA